MIDKKKLTACKIKSLAITHSLTRDLLNVVKQVIPVVKQEIP